MTPTRTTGLADVPAGRSLHGRTAVVTGAASGIGRACAHRLVARGARVACLDRNIEALEELARDLPGLVLPISCDVSDESQVAAAFAAAIREYGQLHVAVLAAGVYRTDDSAVHSLTLDAWNATIAVNLSGLFLTARAAVGAMLGAGRGGSVVFIGSPTGMFGMELGMHAYSASKGGVHGLARVMANEYADAGIRVNVVVPGCIRTGLNAAHLTDRATYDAVTAKIPLGRVGEPEDIAAITAWLASDEATYATGGIFTIDGGLTAV